MMGNRDDGLLGGVWDGCKCSGIVFNDAGKALFERAVERVSAHVEAM